MNPIAGPVRIHSPTGLPEDTRVILPSGELLQDVKSIRLEIRPDAPADAHIGLARVGVDFIADPKMDPPLVKAFDVMDTAGNIEGMAAGHSGPEKMIFDSTAEYLRTIAQTLALYEAGVKRHE